MRKMLQGRESNLCHAGCKYPTSTGPFGRMLALALKWLKKSNIEQKQTPWPESASELYRPSDRRLSTKLVSPSADRECHVDSVTDLYAVISVF
jgi:hypothetical protein